MERQLWVLTGDEGALATSDQAAEGDLVVRRTDGGAEVGELTGAEEPRIEWWGEVDGALLPASDELDGAADKPTPLQRIDGSSALRTAIEGVASAQRERGG